MKKKVLTVILTFNLLSFFNGCKCPDEGYFDYKGINIEVMNTYIPLNSRLLIQVNDIDRYYLAQKSSTLNFGNCAYATSVCEPGYDGEKYPVTNIYISSTSNFDDNHFAGRELNDLIKVYGTNSKGEYILDYLRNFEISKINPWYIYIESHPEIDKKHIFTIKFEKSNGEIVSGISKEVTWE